MGNFSESPTVALTNALNAGYARVRFQQGKPLLDRELNLAADLASPQRIARTFIGNGVAPGGRAFLITGNLTTGDFTIEAGTALVDGLEVRLALNVTYLTQPNRTGLPPFPVGASHIYLRVTTREIATGQDPALGNPGDVGFETAVRDMTDWQVIPSSGFIQRPDHLHLADIDPVANTIVDRRVTNVHVAGLAEEVATARGNTTALSTRLNASLNADGTLAANTVNTTMLVDDSVTSNKLRAHATDNTRRAVGRQHIQDAAVSLAQMAVTVVLDADFTVPAAAAPDQPGETVATIEISDSLAIHLVSVRYVGPRPVLPPALGFLFSIDWVRRETIFKPPLVPAPVRHRHDLLLRNPGGSAITAHCRVLRLEEA